MLAITCLEECNICYDTFTSDKLFSCKNKKCSFKMCEICKVKYLDTNYKCANCNSIIKNPIEDIKVSICIDINLKLYIITILLLYFTFSYVIGYLITKNLSDLFILVNILLGLLVINMTATLISFVISKLNFFN